MNKSIVYLFIFIIFYNISVVSAQTFKQEDLDRLIKNHPLMGKYDKSTGFFKNTAYDRIDINLLKQENASLSKELKSIKTEKNKYSQNISFDDSENDDTWHKLSELDVKIEQLEKQINKNEYIITTNGLPAKLELVKIADSIIEDCILPLYNNNQVVLNKLPQLSYIETKLDYSDLRRFFYTLDEHILNNYLEYSYVIKSLFYDTENIILYQNDHCKSKKICKIDLAKILALHPKMSLFDFNRLGFYKVNSLKLSEEDFNKEINQIKNFKNIDYSDLNNINSELKKIKISLIKQKVALKQKKEESYKLMEDLHQKENKLLRQKENIEYSIINNDLTNVEETKKILEEIKNEVYSLILAHAKKENYEVVFNISLPSAKINSEYGEINQKRLSSFFYLNNFYKILNKKKVSLVQKQELTTSLIRWLELVRSPLSLKRITNENLPILLYGGENIDKVIIQELYNKYELKNEIKEKLISTFLL